jgi:hypothetical protein
MTVGLVTCTEVGGITDDDALLASALRDFGVQVRPVIWDAETEAHDINAFIVRSPWNYHLAPEAFLTWVDSAANSALLWNHPGIVRWNSHKEYLFALERAGIPVAETVLCAKHKATDLRTIMDERNWDQVVVKPAISASSFMTAIVGLPAYALHRETALSDRVVEDGQHLLESILETRDALVQPFMPEIFERGERSLIFIDGDFSHAVQKAPFTDVCGKGRLVHAEPGEVQLGQRALGVLPEIPLYARVDLLRGGDGVDRVMELELIDPELYLRFDADSPRRFASAILRRI